MNMRINDDARKSFARAIQEAEYLPKVQAFAREIIGPKTLKLELKPGMVTWQWGYKNLFLCE